MNELNPREESIFNEARQFPDPEKRAAYLELACNGDTALIQRIEKLLGAGARATDFFAQAASDDDGATLPAFPISEGPGAIIGRYKILQQIGEGGMGAVFMAEQEEPVRRKVALKIIKLGMDTKSVIARFEAERQALALMDHPNIAKVLDAGATETGRPYFVMELVKGVPIHTYCDKNHLDTKERLQLFSDVCRAIRHAHQKGVIHRDIKPSNILVTLHDGKPIPKVIDFGIAKATNQRLTEKTLFTNYAQMIGTPAYMSPEQAEMSGLDIDTRTDVYSLGVLLYELLTGTTPFPEKTLMSKGYGEMQRMIAEDEPQRPSLRMSSMQAGDQTVVAKNRSSELMALTKQFKGDLDWIVMKTLEKDRIRRYDSPKELVADIGRHIADEPVSAAAPSLAYRFGKFQRRHKIAFAYLKGIAVILLLGILVSTWQARRAYHAEQMAREVAEKARKAVEEAKDAQAEAEQERDNTESVRQQVVEEIVRADQIADAMIGFLQESVPSMLIDGNETAARDVLEHAGNMATKTLGDAPATECRLRHEMWRCYSAIGDNKKARLELERIAQLLERLNDDQLPRPRIELEVLIEAIQLWNTTPAEEEHAVAAMNSINQRAIEGGAASRLAACMGLRTLGSWYISLENAQVGEPMIAEAFHRLPESHLCEQSYMVLNSYYQLLIRNGEYAGAEKVVRSLLPVSPNPTYLQFSLHSVLLYGWVRILNMTGRSDEAVTVAEQFKRAELRGQWPEEYTLATDVQLGTALALSGESQKALEVLMRVALHPKVRILDWYGAARGVSVLGSVEQNRQLTRAGILRFASGAEVRNAPILARILLVHPSEDDIELAHQLIKKAKRVRDGSSGHYFQRVLPSTEAVLAVRERRFNDALTILDRGEDDEEIASASSRWHFESVRSIAHANLGRPDRALEYYKAALQKREQQSGYWRLHFQEVWLQEAKELLLAKGILAPEDSEQL